MSCSVVGAFVLLTVVAFESVQAIGGISWNYTDQEFWKTVGQWSCDGMRQSPVNIDANNLVMNSELINLGLTNFDYSYSGNFTNTGHSVQFTPADGSRNATFQNHLGTYNLVQFHFHWGANDEQGSEHTINGRMYGGELHFVTRKTTGNDTASDAFAVLGVFLMSDAEVSSSPSLAVLSTNIPT